MSQVKALVKLDYKLLIEIFSVDAKNGITVMKERITASEAPRLGFDAIKIKEIKTFSTTTK